MKKMIIILGLTMMGGIALSQNTPFTRGVNLTGWFQAEGTTQIPFARYTFDDLANIKSLGCDVVRLPIRLHDMTSGPPDYTIDTLFYFFLDQVVDWAEELELHLILDNHSFDPALSTDSALSAVLVPVWMQMAEHFKHRSELIYYEILNEPHDISDSLWNAVQQKVIDSIRTIDGLHTLIIGPSSWSSYNNLQLMPAYADTNLIYTFHFYEPFLMTHQGAGWTDPSMEPVANIPFPYDPDSMPAVPDQLTGTWVEYLYTLYPDQGTVGYVQHEIDIALDFRDTRNVPLFCGEFGVYIMTSDPVSRANWYAAVSDYMASGGIGWTIWDYQGRFGLFYEGTNEQFGHDLNIPLLEALGLETPAQTPYVQLTDSAGFIIYDDYTGRGICGEMMIPAGTMGFYCSDSVREGVFCIDWTGADQYTAISFTFEPVRDLSYLEAVGSFLDLWVRGDSTGISFDLRFLDTDTDEESDHPWRMNFRVGDTCGPWDGSWKRLQIPLEDFEEMGAFDDGVWYNPEGLFDWSQVERLQIVAETDSLKGIHFWFDNVQIIASTDTVITDPEIISRQNLPASGVLHRNFPNPFSGETRVPYTIACAGPVTLSVTDMQGRVVAVPVNGYHSPGRYVCLFRSGNLQPGTYFYVLQTATGKYVKSMQVFPEER